MLANQGNNLELDSAIGHAIIDTGDQDNNVNPALLDATDNTVAIWVRMTLSAK